jgi:two-component system sensor histidine kinase UhpB
MFAKSDPRPRQRLRLVLDEHERERAAFAHELHEQVAQALAAALLGLDGLAPDAGYEDSGSRIAAVRERIAETLQHCQNLAAGLRSPLLDELGLLPALESLARVKAGVRVDADPALADADLGSALATDVYRLAEGALAAVSGERSLDVLLDPALRQVNVRVRPLDGHAPLCELGALEARLELIGGTLSAGSGELVMRIPIELSAERSIAAFPQPHSVENPDGGRRARA